MSTILYLHIGRNKAASTALQTQWTRNSAYLKSRGLMLAHLGAPDVQTPDATIFDNHLEIREFVLRNPDISVLVSNEIVCCLDLDTNYRMAMDLAELDVRILYYIRPYRNWIISSYNFDVRIGFEHRIFTEYLRDSWDMISAWPIIEAWGKSVGWEKLRIRSIDPADLHNGSVTNDAFAAIDLPRPVGESSVFDPSVRENASVHWYLTELFRMIRAAEPHHGWTPGQQKAAEVIHSCMDEAIRSQKIELPSIRFLPETESLSLVRMYNSDLDRIFKTTGTRLHADVLEPPVTDTDPFTSAIPKRLLRAIRELASDDERPHRCIEAAEFVATHAFTRLCEE